MDILNCFIFILVLFFISFFTFVVNKTSEHADDKHGEIADTIRKTFERKGAFEIWQENIDKNVFHHLIQLDDGRVGDWIIIMGSNKNIEKSVFTPKEGSLPKIHIWLNKKATKL